MPNWKTVYNKPFDKEKWEKAKERAKEEGHENDWPYVVGIYKRMARTGEFKPKFSRQREKKGQTVSEWKKDNPNWKKKAMKKSTVDLASNPSYNKVVATVGGDFDEVRCHSCSCLLLKMRRLHKSDGPIVEVKCKRCGSMNRV